jgi:flagellum-specific peptidoglycan hydrolase FlgJ
MNAMPRRHQAARQQPNPAATAFVAQHVADARMVSATSGVPTSVILAQSALESGWGLHVVDNAYFGVKGRAPNGATTTFVTHEVIQGVAHQVTDNFRAYTSYADAAQDYASMLRRRHPAALAHGNDSLAFVTHLRGYATDPLYVQKLQAIIRTHQLQHYDRP